MTALLLLVVVVIGAAATAATAARGGGGGGGGGADELAALRRENAALRAALAARDAAVRRCTRERSVLRGALDDDTYYAAVASPAGAAARAGDEVAQRALAAGAALPSVRALGASRAAASARAVADGERVPSQLHVALDGAPGDYGAMWATSAKTAASVVQYGLAATALNASAHGDAASYKLPTYNSPYLHHAVMRGLAPRTRYHYRVGDGASAWSDVRSFVTAPRPAAAARTRIAVLGDIGHSEHSVAVVNAIAAEHAREPFDMMLVAGDLSYANFDYARWDEWDAMLSPLASTLPLMAVPGNHELFDLFVSLNHRYIMPANGYASEYYSFNVGPLHVLGLNADSLDGFFHFEAQYRFLVADLKAVDRRTTPWVVAIFHQPWYCSNEKHHDSGWLMRSEYEAAFVQYGVDVVVQGHVHAYERTAHVVNNAVDARGPQYITVGTGGNGEGLYDTWLSPSPAWSRSRIADYGYATLTVVNATASNWTWQNVAGAVKDRAVLTRATAAATAAAATAAAVDETSPLQK